MVGGKNNLRIVDTCSLEIDNFLWSLNMSPKRHLLAVSTSGISHLAKLSSRGAPPNGCNQGNRLIFFIFMKKFHLFFILSVLSLGDLYAQTTGTGAPGLRIDVTGSNEEGDFGVAIQLVVAMTILTLGPSSVIMMMTCFTRIVIVLGFVRNAIGVNAASSSQIIVGLALFLHFL